MLTAAHHLVGHGPRRQFDEKFGRLRRLPLRGLSGRTSSTVIIAEALLAPEEVGGPVAVTVRDGRIEGIAHDLALSGDVVDVRPWRLAPGYIDLHTHGFAGSDVTSGTQADLQAMARALLATGVTAFLPTIASTSPAQTQQQVERIAAAMQAPDPQAAEILGIRLEGPFINPARKGAQDEAAIRPADASELARLAEMGPVRMMDFAPELDLAQSLLRVMRERGIVACIGHTAASYEQALEAIDAGVRHCTHLFNAMPPLAHRAPGVPGALLADSRATVEIIADGVHVHPAVIRLVVAARGPEAIALITDALSAAGLAEGQHSFAGRTVSLREGVLRLVDGTIAGSVLTMDQAVRNVVNHVGCGWSDGVRMASLTPATIVGVVPHKGRLKPGADADFVALDDAGYVRQTWRAGQRVFG
jgi:N-acetylglucosamine-6-phosphate deacetylase